MPQPQVSDSEISNYRLRTPRNAASISAYISKQTWNFITESTSAEKAFANFYTFIDDALNRYIPFRKTNFTIKKRNPSYLTLYLKLLPRKRNTLHRRHDSEAADDLATRINTCIAKNNSTSFHDLERGSSLGLMLMAQG